jgi:hypothetical protein
MPKYGYLADHFACLLEIAGILVFGFLAWPDRIGWGVVAVALVLVGLAIMVRPRHIRPPK